MNRLAKTFFIAAAGFAACAGAVWPRLTPHMAIRRGDARPSTKRPAYALYAAGCRTEFIGYAISTMRVDFPHPGTHSGLEAFRAS